MSRNRVMFLYLRAAVVATIAVRVEILNARAGDYLPRDLLDDAGKWREVRLDESSWRRVIGPRDVDGVPVAQLSQDEQQQMRSDLARNQLRAWLRTAGLLQHLLLPAVAIGALLALRAHPTRRSLLILSPILVTVLCAAKSLWYRGYYSSLGW